MERQPRVRSSRFPRCRASAMPSAAKSTEPTALPNVRTATTGFADLGHKALAVNLSDLAAMGADPVAALVGLGLPDEAGPGAEEIDELYAGMEALAERTGVSVAGGDVTAAPVMVLSVC